MFKWDAATERFDSIETRVTGIELGEIPKGMLLEGWRGGLLEFLVVQGIYLRNGEGWLPNQSQYPSNKVPTGRKFYLLNIQAHIHTRLPDAASFRPKCKTDSIALLAIE